MRGLAIYRKSLVLMLAVLCALGLSATKVDAAILEVNAACSLHDAIIAANRDAASGGCPAGAGGGHYPFDGRRHLERRVAGDRVGHID